MTSSGTTGKAPPTLSVVVVVYAGKDYLARCLHALSAQGAPGANVEVIVAHEGGALDALTHTHVAPDVDETLTVRHVSGDAGCGPARLRALGAEAAQAEVIAFTEDHCQPASDWCAAVLSAHATSTGVIGGAIEKLADDTGLNWAGYLLTYGRYMPPLVPGSADYLSDCNVSYRREHLTLVRDVWRSEFHETSVNWALKKRGIALIAEPGMVVRQQRSLAWRAALAEQLEHGAIFARTRIVGMPTTKRLTMAALSPVLPLVTVVRTLNRVRSREGRVPLARALPGLVALATAWAVGELRGYLGSAPRA